MFASKSKVYWQSGVPEVHRHTHKRRFVLTVSLPSLLINNRAQIKRGEGKPRLSLVLLFDIVGCATAVPKGKGLPSPAAVSRSCPQRAPKGHLCKIAPLESLPSQKPKHIKCQSTFLDTPVSTRAVWCNPRGPKSF